LLIDVSGIALLYALILLYFTYFVHSYTQNGILHMLDRNRRIKPKPERFQSCKDHFDIIVSCEERVYDQVIEGMLQLQHSSLS